MYFLTAKEAYHFKLVHPSCNTEKTQFIYKHPDVVKIELLLASIVFLV